MKNRGFTLIELLAVIVIIGLLAVFVIPSILRIFGNFQNKAFITEAKSVYKAALDQKDSDTIGNQIIEEYNSFDKKLPLNNKKINYLITFNEENKISSFCMSDGKNKISLNNSSGLSIDNIETIEESSEKCFGLYKCYTVPGNTLSNACYASSSSVAVSDCLSIKNYSNCASKLCSSYDTNEGTRAKVYTVSVTTPVCENYFYSLYGSNTVSCTGGGSVPYLISQPAWIYYISSNSTWVCNKKYVTSCQKVYTYGYYYKLKEYYNDGESYKQCPSGYSSEIIEE